MSKVMIDKARLDDLAEKISIKSKIKLPLTITGMINAVQSIDTKDKIRLQSKTITPTISYQTVTADENYDGLSKVKLNIPIKNQNSLFASGQNVYVPAGYYNTQVSKAVSTMSLPTTPTPTARGTRKAIITPGTNDRYINIPYGYNTSCAYYTILGDINLVSDNIISGKSIFGVQGNVVPGTVTLTTTSIIPSTSSITLTPTNGYGFSTVTVASITAGSAGVPVGVKSSVNNHSVTITPTVTNSTGYILGGTKTGTAITVLASQLVSGTRTITSNATHIDVTNYANVDVNVAGSGTANLQTKTYTVTAAGTFTITPDNGYNGLDSVQAIVPQGELNVDEFGIENVTTISVSSSGLITAKTDLDNWFEPVLTSGYINNTSTAHIYINGTKTYQLSTQSGITVTPTTSQQTIVTAGKYTTGAIKVDAMPNGSTGTPVATKNAVVNNTITIKPTVTNTTGYITGGTITGSSITISAAELVNGIKTVTANGSWDVTKYATVSVNVPGGQEGSGDAELTEIQIDTKNTTLSTASFSIQFTGLNNEPTSFVIISTDNIAMVSGMTTAIVYDGTYLHGQTLTTQVEASTDFNKLYSNGTLTITGGDSQFQAGTYKLIYSYEGSTTDIHTSDVQVGSGATSISFSGLLGRPLYWSCIFKSNFSTSSGYQRVIAVANDGTSTFGLDMDSSAHAASAWTATYNNGTLTITSQGTNNGGYFHQPGYYQLTYVTNEQTEVVSSTIDTKTTTASNYSNSISFTNMQGEPKMFVCRCNTSISSSGSTAYYYIIDIAYDGTNTKGSYFRIGSTRQVTPISSGYNWTYNNNTLTLTSTANDRSATPGTFYSGSYELIYVY